MISLDDWWKNKKAIDNLRRKADKIEAEYKVALQEVQEKDKVKTIKQAKLKLKRNTQLVAKFYQKWVKLHKAFQLKHGKKLLK